MGDNDSRTVDLESLGEDDPRRRLAILSQQEVAKVYKKGFKLLQKAGLKAGDPLEPPLRVAIRKTREGLKDDDLAQREAVGEPRSRTKRRVAASDNIEFTGTQSSLEDLAKILPDVSSYIERQGGSAPISEIVSRVLKPRIPRITLRGFLVAARLGILSTVGLKITEDENVLILSKPTGRHFEQIIPCACGSHFSDVIQWARHVFNASWEGHQVYSRALKEITVKASCLVCLNPRTLFPDILSLIQHCRNLSDDKDHSKFAEFLILKVLHRSDDPLDENVKMLLLRAIESCDAQFPWRSIGPGIADPELTIPFPDGPPTPIYLDDSDSEVISNSDVVEVVNLDNNLINLEE